MYYYPKNSTRLLYYANLFLPAGEPEISNESAELIVNYLNYLISGAGGEVRHTIISKRKIGIYFEVPITTNLEHLIKTMLHCQESYLPRWDKQYSLLTVGMPFKYLEQVLSSYKNKFTYINN